MRSASKTSPRGADVLCAFTFTLSPARLGVLLQAPWVDVLRAIPMAATGIAALAMRLGGWLRRTANLSERVLATTGGLLLFSATILTQLIGAVIFATAVAVHLTRGSWER